MSTCRKRFEVFIHNGELARIRQWVTKYQNIETGGDLFGLWSGDRTVVVQFVLGPGEGSRRTPVSFFQDSNYLKTAGSALTTLHSLCHIGEWHSHHKLGLAEPSDGDQRTVQTNMPQYSWNRFILFIANIPTELEHRYESVGTVGIGCFPFVAQAVGARAKMSRGEFHVIAGQSPFRKFFALSESLKDAICNKAELENEPEEERCKATSTPVGTYVLSREILCRAAHTLVAGRHLSDQHHDYSHEWNKTKTANESHEPLIVFDDCVKEEGASRGLGVVNQDHGDSSAPPAYSQCGSLANFGCEEWPHVAGPDATAVAATNFDPYWSRVPKAKQNFLKQTQKKLGGDMVYEPDSVTIVFFRRVFAEDKSEHWVDSACKLEYKEIDQKLWLSAWGLETSREISLQDKEHLVDRVIHIVVSRVKEAQSQNKCRQKWTGKLSSETDT